MPNTTTGTTNPVIPDHVRISPKGAHVWLAGQEVFLPEGETFIFYEHRNPETGEHFVWNINAAKQLGRVAPENAYRTIRIPFTAAELLAQYEGLDVAYAMGTDLREPSILAELPDGTYRMIDGWHKTYRALVEGHTDRYAFIIPWVVGQELVLMAHVPADHPTVAEMMRRAGLGECFAT